MSVIQKVIADAKANIPKQVLEVAFRNAVGRESRWASNIDWAIRDKVIDARVRVDCDLLGAIEDNIPLFDSEVQYDNLYRISVRVPKARTKGRVICAALALNYIYNTPGGMINNGYNNNSYNMSNCGNSPLMNSASKILHSSAPASILSTASLQIIGENVILISDYMGSVSQCSLTVRLTHDPEMNNINPATIPQFSQLVEYAVKAWIYNNTIITLDMGELYGGSELGRISGIIEGYADAGELYKEYFREEWTAVSFMNDQNRNANYLRTLIGGAAV